MLRKEASFQLKEEFVLWKEASVLVKEAFVPLKEVPSTWFVGGGGCAIYSAVHDLPSEPESRSQLPSIQP